MNGIVSEADERAKANGCWFDERAAERVWRFYPEYLRHSKGQYAGKPFELLDWQRELLGLLFGWKRQDGTRRYRRAYVEIPKKNGKSTIACGIGLYMLRMDREPGAKVFSVAVDKGQAMLVQEEAINMVHASPALDASLSVNGTTHAISHRDSLSRWEVFALEQTSGKYEGRNAHCLIMDELHAWKGRRLWDQLLYAGAGRTQPLRFVITTAGDDPQSVCREQHDHAVGVLNGTVYDESFFGYIRCADEADDWTSPEIWRKANPSFGHVISERELADSVAEAKLSASATAAFKRYRLNVWCTSETPWLRLDDWQAAAEEFTEDDLAGQECIAALDLAKTRDMTALVLVFDDGEIIRLLPYLWMPEATAHDRRALIDYAGWAKAGHLHLTPGETMRYDLLEADFTRLAEKFYIRELVFDPWGAEATTQSIAEKLGIERVQFKQSMGNFAEATAEFERRLLNRTLKHNGNPVLAWQAGHCQVYSDANGNKRPVKPKVGDIRTIDGIVASVMGVARWMQQTQGAVGIQFA